MVGEAVVRAESPASAGLSFRGGLSLGLIVAVVVVVSLPRLRGLARHENEVDARYTASMLGRALSQSPDADLGERSPAIARLTGSVEIEKALSDAKLLEEGRLLQRHGYLFAVVDLPSHAALIGTEPGAVLASAPIEPGSGGEEPVRAICAWPWKHGTTGAAALFATDDGAVYRHANTPARWNGPLADPSATFPRGGWRRLP